MQHFQATHSQRHALDHRSPTAFETQVAVSQSASEGCDLLMLAAPGFSSLALVSVVEVFRAANTLIGCNFFRWFFVAQNDPDSVPDLAALLPDGRQMLQSEIDSAIRTKSLTFAFASEPLDSTASKRLVPIIRRAHRSGSRIIEVGSGAGLLPQLGLLDHAQYAVHPRDRAAFAEKFPDIPISDAVFSVGSRTISCCGEAGALELALYLVGSAVGIELAHGVRRLLLLEAPRNGPMPPKVWTTPYGWIRNRHLSRAIDLMERHVEDPLTQPQVAKLCEVSSRQLQRLFSTLIGATYIDVYMGLRLERARALLKSTDLPVIEVATACGFTSGSYFAQSAKKRWGSTPSQCRGDLDLQAGS